MNIFFERWGHRRPKPFFKDQCEELVGSRHRRHRVGLGA